MSTKNSFQENLINLIEEITNKLKKVKNSLNGLKKLEPLYKDSSVPEQELMNFVFEKKNHRNQIKKLTQTKNEIEEFLDSICDKGTVSQDFSTDDPSFIKVISGDLVVIYQTEAENAYVKLKSINKPTKGYLPTNVLSIDVVQVSDFDSLSSKIDQFKQILIDMEKKESNLNNRKLSPKTISSIYSFDAGNDDELTISENEKLILIEHREGGWSYVENLKGQKGIVPTSYLNLQVDSSNPNSEMIVLFSFDSENPDELTIVENEVVSVIEVKGDWTKVKNIKGDIGIVPTNYLQPKINTQTDSIDNNSNKDKSNADILEEKEDGWLLVGEKNQNSQEDFSPGNYFLVLENYEKADSDEISLQKNSKVKFVSNQGNGWCTVEFEGKTGLFPITYLELIREDLKPKKVDQKAKKMEQKTKKMEQKQKIQEQKQKQQEQKQKQKQQKIQNKPQSKDEIIKNLQNKVNELSDQIEQINQLRKLEIQFLTTQQQEKQSIIDSKESEILELKKKVETLEQENRKFKSLIEKLPPNQKIK
ncbi:cdc42-interacting protein 4 isoform b [Anaeramoeba ignava]|uniref:Cdc42-interacting protein 4 isoform b n=1 Tax=Anaeramoeba ignava TaxID=1746090 RepID=A0A9Q0LS71_ANAIG|nr:cdc42-interacting protein 4 isoform b [Anaeramoeba ignava]